MSKFGLFKMVVKNGEGHVSVTFSAVGNPIETNKPMVIEAESASDAAEKAKQLLATFGGSTHSRLGDYDLVMADFPNYFVGELRIRDAEMYMTESIAYRIVNFVPVPQ